jgi:predicted nucleic acid-binding protein
VATSADPQVLVDTSAAIALVVADHAAHGVVTAHLADRRLGLAGHAAFETYSVLTRLPGPSRLSAADTARVIRANFPGTRFLGADATAELHRSLPRLGVGGGAVYDALVGAAARAHDLPLATRDEKALEIYRSIGCEVELIN